MNEQIGLEGLNILLVDSKPYFRKGMRDLLMNEFDGGINQISEASNGREFLTIIKEFPANLVFIETEMPEMNGIEATNMALKQNPQLKIYALSAYDDSQYVAEMINAGAEGFVSKNEDILQRLRVIFKTFQTKKISDYINIPEAILSGLMFACPMHDQLSTCPLYKLRSIPANERVSFLKRLSKSEKASLYATHRTCLHEREKN